MAEHFVKQDQKVAVIFGDNVRMGTVVKVKTNIRGIVIAKEVRLETLLGKGPGPDGFPVHPVTVGREDIFPDYETAHKALFSRRLKGEAMTGITSEAAKKTLNNLAYHARVQTSLHGVAGGKQATDRLKYFQRLLGMKE